MSGLREIRHPGPVADCRHSVARAVPVALDFTLPAGVTVQDGLVQGVAAVGCASAWLDLDPGRLDPFVFVMPALSPDGAHAAWYSDPVAPEGGVQLRRAGAMVGWRDGAGFVHCHGLWADHSGAEAMGHMLCDAAVVAAPLRVRGIGLRGARLVSREDPETRFRLFTAEGGCAQGSALVVTLRPNQDVGTALAAIAAAHGLGPARVHGLGSLNGARFEDAPPMHSVASEFLVCAGRIAAGRAMLEVAIVDIDGRIHRGRLRPGENPVCVTCEFVLTAAP